MRPGTYLIVALGVAAALVGAVLAVNARIDPYGLAAIVASPDEAGVIEGARPGIFWRKALAVRNPMPRTVILGTSRAEFGLDPRHPGFAPEYQPVENLALGGVSIEQIRLLLIHANVRSPLKMAVIGLDMESFIDQGRADFDPAALLGNPESEPQRFVRLRVGVSRESLAASLARLSLPEPAAADANVGGKPAETPAWRIPDEALRLWDGQRGIVWVAEYDNFHSRLRYLFPKGPSASVWAQDGRRAAAMRSFRELLRYARNHDIELRLFISPVHARYLEWYQRVGWWPLFESWKRALVETIDAEAKADGSRPAYVLWDFASYHAISTEPVPMIGDHATRMRWYRETSHYAPEVGNLVLDRILGVQASEPSPLPDGRMSAATIEQHLSEIRSGAVRYRLSEPNEVADLDDMLAYLRREAKR